MFKAIRVLLRPFERFLAQWISVSTEPSAFVRERVRLGDTTNFLRAVGLFFSAISTAFLAEVGTLHLLGVPRSGLPVSSRSRDLGCHCHRGAQGTNPMTWFRLAIAFGSHTVK